MDLRDARRLGSTCLVIAGLLLLWLILLALDDAGLFDWSWPTGALEALSLGTWMWIGVGMLVLLVAGMLGVIFAMGLGAKAPTRQVQCQDCRAVFFIPDNGRRPLSHTCPSCKAFGIYEGGETAAEPAPAPAAAPPGAAPAAKPAPAKPTRSFTCPSCSERFSVTDPGVRPLRITCPKCATSGVLK